MNNQRWRQIETLYHAALEVAFIRPGAASLDRGGGIVAWNVGIGLNA
jgi:hypothetical protein